MGRAMGRRRQPLRPFVDRILEGRLTDILVGYRREGLTYERMARSLATDHDIDVTGELVRMWCVESKVDSLAAKPDQAAS